MSSSIAYYCGLLTMMFWKAYVKLYYIYASEAYDQVTSKLILSEKFFRSKY